MKENVNILNFISFYTEIFFEDLQLSTATSFAYEYNNVKYLITNYHVVFGKNPFNEKLLNQNGSIPNKLKFYYFDVQMNLKSFVINLNEADIRKCSYLEKGTVKYYDIAAIVLPSYLDCACVNQFKYYPSNLKFGVSSHAYVLGYPKSINLDKLPIWKSAYLASEFSSNYNELPCVLIDSGTKEGMSGSPVIIYDDSGTYRTTDGDVVLTEQFVYRFIGLYSGRDIVENLDDDRLGIVWKEESIIKTINSVYKFTYENNI